MSVFDNLYHENKLSDLYIIYSIFDDCILETTFWQSMKNVINFLNPRTA